MLCSMDFTLINKLKKADTNNYMPPDSISKRLYSNATGRRHEGSSRAQVPNLFDMRDGCSYENLMPNDMRWS